MSIFDSIRDLFTPAKPLPAGVYHFQSPEDEKDPYRLHLRIQGDGNSILVVNAATVLHLNPTATEYAYHLVQGTPVEEAASKVAKRYRVNKEQALGDFQNFSEQIDILVHTEDLDPVSFLGFDRVAPHSEELIAPLRLDGLEPGMLRLRAPSAFHANFVRTHHAETIRQLASAVVGPRTVEIVV